jgi:hypothetical protein
LFGEKSFREKSFGEKLFGETSFGERAFGGTDIVPNTFINVPNSQLSH